MIKEVIVNAEAGQTRAAVKEDQVLVELYIERTNDKRIAGNIYKGRVENVLPGMQAAFVNIGLERNAFLYVDDAVDYKNGDDDGEYYAAQCSSGKTINEILRPNQEIIVQVTKEPVGTKGARVVTQLTIPGRYLVLMPTVDHIGVSRRIDDAAERERLRKVGSSLKPQGIGLIVRTAAAGKNEEDLKADRDFLLRVWSTIQADGKRHSPPALLYRDYDLIYRLVRDVFTQDISRFIVDSKQEYQKILDLLDSLSPALKNRVFYFGEKTPIFEAFGIESEINKLVKRKVWLDCGGYLIIDDTEALISIDVNTGKFIGSTNLADTVLKTNLEAATEIARQLRLRNIGGIVIIDFIDMDSKADEQKVLERLEQEFAKDKTKVHVLGFTNLGLVELTRKKVYQDLGETLFTACPYCGGAGHVFSETSIALQVERQVRHTAGVMEGEAIFVQVHPHVASLLIGSGGSNLRRLEEETGKYIYVKGCDELRVDETSVIAASTRQQAETMALPVSEGQIIEIEVEEPHISNPKDGIARIEGYVLDIQGAGQHVGRKLQVQITKVFRTYAKGKVIDERVS
ncbi:MAG: Rne/Rng family ribonuclease [Limnochordia bacterium]|nr:Rne/Rng family ribonuclease [Limnochordia bacterium]MDD2628797.1 Rne/Rng family ribonuclease [Limnochordia bacterium]MDD4518239.1 Rne/Rng family ribonuclease [Limnochordia bacterium]